MAKSILPGIPSGTTGLKTPATTESILKTQYENLAARLGAVEAPVDDRGFVGKLLNLEQDQGFFMDVLEVLDRPGQAVKGFIAPEEGDNPFTGFAKGLAGMTDRSSLETLVDLDVLSEGEVEEMGGVAKFAINVAGDLLTDPLTYLPAGSIGKALSKLNPFKQQKTAEIMISQVDEIKKAYKAAYQAATDAGATAQEATEQAAKQLNLVFETSDNVKAQVAKFDKQIKAASKKLDDLKARGLDDNQIGQLTKKQGGLTWQEWELIGMNDLKNDLVRTAEDLKVAGAKVEVTSMAGQSAPGKTDIDILLDLDDGNFVRVAQVQVKKATTGAMGATAMLGKAKSGVLGFADNVRLTPQAQKILQDNYSNVMVTIKGKGGKTTQKSVAEIVDNMVKQAEKGVKAKGLGFSINNVSKADLDKIQQAAKAVMDTQYADDAFIYVIAKDGTSDLFRWGDIKNNISYKPTVRVGTTNKGKTIQPRLQIGLELDRLPVDKSARGVFRNTVLNIKPQKETYTVSLGFFDWARRRSNAFAPYAEKIYQFNNSIKRSFNAFFQFGDDTTAAFRRLSAESQMVVTNEGRRLSILSEEAVRRAPNGEEILQELLETGARVVDGKVVVQTTYLTMTDTLRMFSDDWLKYGGEMPLAVYGAKEGFRARTADNILSTMNAKVRAATGIDDAFQIVKKGDEYFLSLNQLDPDDLARLMKDQTFLATTGDTLSFGRKRLTDEQIDFYLQNEDLVDQYRSIDENIMSIYDNELGIQNIPDAIKTTNGYVRHRLSTKGAEWLKESQPLVYSKYMREGVDLLANRKYMGTVDDINRVMKAMYDIDFDFFDTNITNSLADLLRVGATKQESGAIVKAILQGADDANRPLFQVIDNTKTASLGPDFEYINDFKEEFSKMYQNLAPDARKVLDDYLKAQGLAKGKAIAVHKTANATLKRIENAYVEVPTLLKNYDAILNQWKGLNLVTPTFHLNNFFGNSVNSFLVGMGVVDQGIYLTRSSSYLRQYDRILGQIDNIILSGGSRADAIKALDAGDREIYEVLIGYLNSGASMKGRGVRDLKGVTNTLEQGGQKGLYRELLEANFNLAENADELQRFSLYMWAYDKELQTLGGAVDDVAKMGARTKAANKVFESMFDYSHYTRFEQDVMKRMIPFYTFMKNNLVFQMRNIAKNPAQYNKLGRAYKYYVSDIAGLTDEDMPEYARNNMWLPIPITVNRGDKETITFLKASLPPAEFGELIESRFARGVSSLTIPLKLPIELALNRDIFTGAEIREFAGQKDRMEPGTGALSFLRDEQGVIALSGDPVIQKIANDLGARVPARYVTTALGIVDAATGYKDPEDAFAEALNSLGVLSIRESESIRVTNLYQALEKYREAEKRWEQEMGMDLPTKRELRLP